MARPRPRRSSLGPWLPTSAHVRATGLGLVGVALGAGLRRPDLVVLAAPLLVCAVWGTVGRPATRATVRVGVSSDTVREGGTVDVAAVATTPTGTEALSVVLPEAAHAAYEPASGSVVTTPAGTSTTTAVRCRSTRWGRHAFGPVFVSATSGLGSHRCQVLADGPLAVSTLPVPDVFDSRAPMPHPVGLVGSNRSVRIGEGTELSDIRPFRLGDRIKRVHWPVSLRTGELHVTTTDADQDAEIHLIVDAVNDIGPSDGIGGRSSSLDNATRAAGALAEHFLARGERVGVSIIGARNAPTVRPGSGRRHLDRILGVLAAVEPDDGSVTGSRAVRAQLGAHRVSAGAIVVVLTPVASPEVLGHALGLGRRGFSVIVVDTLPSGLATGGRDALRSEAAGDWVPGGEARGDVSSAQVLEYASLAWRLRLVERDLEIRRARADGLPITPWRGPGSLDVVLRHLAQRARAPRVVHR